MVFTKHPMVSFYPHGTLLVFNQNMSSDVSNFMISNEWARHDKYSRRSVGANSSTATLFNCKFGKCNKFAVIAPANGRMVRHFSPNEQSDEVHVHFTSVDGLLTLSVVAVIGFSFAKWNVNMLQLSNVYCRLKSVISTKMATSEHLAQVPRRPLWGQLKHAVRRINPHDFERLSQKW